MRKNAVVVNRAHNNNISGGDEHSGSKRLNPVSHVTSAATVGDLTAEEKREGDEDVGSLPRTLSTSVLRIKHRRSFWEKVVGYVRHSLIHSVSDERGTVSQFGIWAGKRERDSRNGVN